MSRRTPSLTHPADPADLTVVITGGARGIGLATAERLAAAGARVAIGDVDTELADEAAARLDARYAGGAGRVRAAPLDVSSEQSWRAFLSAVSPLGPVDVLVNNAGVMPLGSALEEPDSVTRTILDVNVRGVVNGTRAVAPGMVERGRGHLVNVASAVGRVATPGGATYSASKFAVIGYSEAVRGELRPHGVAVSLVLPTVVRTELAAGVRQARGMREVSAEEVAEAIEATVRRPAAETWVPRWTKPMSRATGLLPRRLQDAMAHAFGADRLLLEVDMADRAGYESRARRSAAAAEGEIFDRPG